MKLKLCLLLIFVITHSWSQAGSTKTFTTSSTFPVPAGVTSIIVQAWGGGGSGGGASGAPLLLGRGAAGGGGGAYVNGPVLVTPGTTLNVVVAGQTPGTSGANGTAGGNSTITGFESSIFAAGGAGGTANNAGGTPVGGSGGTTAASAGANKFAGVNGGNGNSWNLLGILLSSGAGGAGAGSGGAGGAVVSGLIFSNAPGNAGSAPGGAGSGAINSALGASQIGGAGAAGQVIISYSCANFSLTSTAATNICASAGATSTVTLTGSASSLPVGNYIVTYNRSSPTATALTANLTVSTAGTGTFTAVGLTTGGASTITITKLESESCSSNITTNNTATITVSPASVGGTVSGGSAINAGSTSGLLTLSGHTGSIVKWQSSVSPFTTWTDIANTTTTYTSGPLTETTQFRAVVQSGSCAVANSAATTVTVNARPTITLASSSISICSSNDGSGLGALLPYTGTTESPTTYSILWNLSPANSFAAVTDAALPANSIPIAVPAGIVPGTYTGTLTVKNANGAVSSPSTIFTVTINETPLITTTGTIASVCTSTNAQNTTLAYSGVTGNPISYFIDWNSLANAASLADQGVTSFAFAPGGGIINTIQVSANAQPGTYYGQMYISTAICNQLQQVSITILPASVGGTVSGGTTINAGDTSGLLTLSGHTGSIVKWQSSVSPFTTWTDIANTTTTYTSGPLTETTQFRAVVQSGSCAVANSAETIVTVNPLPTITLASSAISRCSIGVAASLPLAYTGTTGSPTTYSIVWNPSPANNFVPFTDAPLPANTIQIITSDAGTVGTFTGTLTVKNASGGVSLGSVVTVTINESPFVTTSGTISSVCTSANSQNAALAYSGATGNPVSYSIDWSFAANNASLADQGSTPFAFVSGGGILNTIQIPSSVPAGNYSGTMTIFNGICNQYEIVSITILPGTVGGTVTGGTTIVSGNTSGLLTLSGYTGSVVKWQSSVSPFSTWTDIVNTNTTYTSGALTETTQFRAVVQNGICSVENSEPTTVTVNPLPTITISTQAEDVCSDIFNDYTTTLSYSETTGSPVTYSIVWDSSPTNSLLAVTDAALPVSPITINIPVDTAAGTYKGTITMKDANGNSSLGSTFTAKINETPTINRNVDLNPVCTSNTLQYGSLLYYSTSGNPTTYSIDWNDDANNALLTDQLSTPFAFASNGGVINTIQIPANVPGGQYTGTITIKNEFCPLTFGTIVLTILPSPVGGTVTGGTTIAYGSTSDLLTLSGHTGSVVKWQYSVSPFSSWFDIFTTDTTFTSGPLTETTQFRAVVKSGTCGTEFSEPTTVTVEDLPTITLATAAANLCVNNSNAQNTTLDYSATTGSPTTYSIVWNSSPTNSFAAVTDVVLPASPINIAIPAGAAVGNYTGTLTVKNASGAVSSPESVFTVTINQAPSITSEGILGTTCSSNESQTITLQYTSSTGNPTSYSIDWDSTANAAFLADLPSTPEVFLADGNYLIIEISANALPGTYSGIMSFTNGTCSGSHPVSVTIKPRPTAPVIESITQTTEEDSGTVTLTGMPESAYVILINPIEQSISTSGPSPTIELEPGTYTFQVRNSATSCTSVASDTVVINYPPIWRVAPVKDSSTKGTADVESLKNPVTISALNKVINVETANQVIDKVYIFDVSGNLIYQKAGVSDPKLIITDLRSSNQVLVVKVILNNSHSETKTIIF